MAYFYCLPNSCGVVRYREYLPPQIRYRYENEDWQYDDDLTITVADGNSSDTFTVNIPRTRYRGGGDGYDPHIESNLNGKATYQDGVLTISIADGESATTFQVEIMDEIIKEKIDKIYKILGGDNWSTSGNGGLSLDLNPETRIKLAGNQLYTKNSNELSTVTVNNLLELEAAYAAVDFYRSGHHRLPATVLTSLLNTDKGNEPLTIFDTLSFSEWIVNQLDGLIGEFPLKLRYQNVSSEGEAIDTELELQNVSEAIAELMALSLATAQDSDLAINIGMKNLVEARMAANAAITAVDYAAANAEYLGYKGNETKRDVPLTFTPGAVTLADTLKPSTKSIKGWKNDDKETLAELIKRTLVAAEIVKASMYHPYEPGGSVTGDAIKEKVDAQKTADDEKWEEFKNRVNNPSGRYAVPKPKAKIRDLTIDDNSTQP